MTTAKLDLFKLHRGEYAGPRTPAIVETRPATYLAIAGQGEPGGAAFTASVGALYGVAYTVKMAKKAAGQDYRVCPLEGLWWGSGGNPDFSKDPPGKWRWKLIIRTPEFVTDADVREAGDALVARGKGAEVRNVRVETIDEGVCVQMLHVGPYSTEGEDVARMSALAGSKGLAFHGLHHEIYLSDPRRVPEERWRTILRMPVRAA